MGVGTKASVVMKHLLGKWNCSKCGSSQIAPVAAAPMCKMCSDLMRLQPRGPGAGTILRRWAADGASSVGTQVRARASLEDPLVADVRRLQLVAVASKLAEARVARVR